MSMFGKEFDQIWPKAGTQLKLTEFGRKLLKQCETVKKPEQKEVDIDEFKRKSSNFPIEFGTNTCRVMSQPKDRYPNIQKQITSAYPVIHERVVQLYLDFLEHKCKYGSSLEKELYQNMSLTDLVQRLLTKRCVTFQDAYDRYTLINKESGFAYFMLVGNTELKKPLEPIGLDKALYYSEIKLSAFLTISSKSEFINDGKRQNRGHIEKNLNKIEREGFVVSLIGARFERPMLMEYQDIIISTEQNTPENGYGFLNSQEYAGKVDSKLEDVINYRYMWQKFYEENDFISDSTLKDQPRYDNVSIPTTDFQSLLLFDNLMMKKRYSLLFDLLLLESQHRAQQLNKMAYIHVVGVGLDCWKVLPQQTDIYLKSFYQRVQHLLPQLNNIGVLHFAWFGNYHKKNIIKHNGFIKSKTHRLGGIKTFVKNRNPYEKLPREFKDMLLIVSYGGNANALPGNEFWSGTLGGSDGTSTACSTLISELHNPHINEEYVNGQNLHVVTMDEGIMHIGEYAKKILEQ